MLIPTPSTPLAAYRPEETAPVEITANRAKTVSVFPSSQVRIYASSELVPGIPKLWDERDRDPEEAGAEDTCATTASEVEDAPSPPARPIIVSLVGAANVIAPPRSRSTAPERVRRRLALVATLAMAFGMIAALALKYFG